MQIALRQHKCRGIVQKSRYQTRCAQKISPDKYEQGVRYCRLHLDQQGENDEVSTTRHRQSVLIENQASSTDSQGEEQTAVYSGQEDNVDGVFQTSQTQPAPFLYIGNSTQYTSNPQATDNRPPHRDSTKEPKQREVKPHQTSVKFSVGPDHNGSSRRHSVRGSDYGHMERQESNPQRTAQNKRSLNDPVVNYRSIAAQAPTSQQDDLKQRLRSQSEVPRVAPQRHQSIGTFPSSRPRHSGSPSQYKQQSVPLYPSYTIKQPMAPYKPASESPSTLLSTTRNPISHVESQHRVDPALPATTYTRNQQSDLTYGSWKAPDPTSSSRAEPRPRSFHQPQSVHTPTNTNTQPTPRQREKRPQTSQDQALDRTSSTREAPVFPFGQPTDQFSFDIAGHRQTRVSTAQIQQQVQSFSVPLFSCIYASLTDFHSTLS